jgi:hypothetical protein
MKKLVIIGIIGAVILTFAVGLYFSNMCRVYIVNAPSNGPSKDVVIPENEWKVVQQSDSSEMILVEWDQKYGDTKKQYCRLVFQNGSQYKLVAPWVNMLIEKTNTNNICYTKVPFDSLKINGQ